LKWTRKARPGCGGRVWEDGHPSMRVWRRSSANAWHCKRDQKCDGHGLII
jgi:hypothetical protein